jgi:DNA-binding response OmpR family regulator
MLTMAHNTVQTEPSTNPLPPFAPTPRILVVIADDDMRALYCQPFQLSGCHVIESSDGRDALTKALVSPPSLVVTEIRLPFLDGYALCAILRHDWATAETPILVVTAEGRPAETDRARNAGADIVVAEPTTLEQIVSLSRRLIAEAKDLRGRAAATKASVAAPREISENTHADFGAPGYRSRCTPASPPRRRQHHRSR